MLYISIWNHRIFCVIITFYAAIFSEFRYFRKWLDIFLIEKRRSGISRGLRFLTEIQDAVRTGASKTKSPQLRGHSLGTCRCSRAPMSAKCLLAAKYWGSQSSSFGRGSLLALAVFVLEVSSWTPSRSRAYHHCFLAISVAASVVRSDSSGSRVSYYSIYRWTTGIRKPGKCICDTKRRVIGRGSETRDRVNVVRGDFI